MELERHSPLFVRNKQTNETRWYSSSSRTAQADDIELEVDQLEKAIKAVLPKVNRIYIEAETIKRGVVQV